MNGLYADLLQEVKSKGTITNAFGIERTFLGDPKDSGTLREIAGYVGQSDTAGNMNRSQYEIDHGYIPAKLRDGGNPDARDETRKMDWKRWEASRVGKRWVGWGGCGGTPSNYKKKTIKYTDQI